MAEDGTFERMTKREALSLQARARRSSSAEPGRHQGHERAARRDVRHRRRLSTRSRSPRRRSSASRSSRVVDTNHSPDGIAHVIPGNDDSSRAIRLYARGAADAVLEGTQHSRSRRSCRAATSSSRSRTRPAQKYGSRCAKGGSGARFVDGPRSPHAAGAPRAAPRARRQQATGATRWRTFPRAW